ncbi:MAG: glycerate kinase [Kiritimatiellia bacterium]
MRVLVAMDSFKGTLSAKDACRCVKRGLLKARPDLEVVTRPMADGGEGTLDVLLETSGGNRIAMDAHGPIFGRKVRAAFGWIPKTKLALVEMAQASGLLLVSGAERDPMKTTTFGTGELLRAALELHPDKILLAVGGSATVDGGVGAAMALGWRFLDPAGRPVGYGGGELRKIASIVPPRERFPVKCSVLCDVDNPLCGAHGAARVYGPQKGASPDAVVELERGLQHLAQLVNEKLGLDIAAIPGGGAAGGLAGGAAAFMNAELVPGSQAVIEAIGLEDEIRKADYVITGEGRFDGQSARGKVVAGMASVAQKHGVPVIVLAGDVVPYAAEKGEMFFERAISARLPGMPLDEALARAAELLECAAAQAAAGF